LLRGGRYRLVGQRIGLHDPDVLARREPARRQVGEQQERPQLEGGSDQVRRRAGQGLAPPDAGGHGMTPQDSDRFVDLVMSPLYLAFEKKPDAELTALYFTALRRFDFVAVRRGVDQAI